MEKYCKKTSPRQKNEYSIIIKINTLEIPTFCVIQARYLLKDNIWEHTMYMNVFYEKQKQTT